MPIRRETERRLCLLLEIQVQGRQRRAQAEGARRQQYILDGGVDRRTRPADGRVGCEADIPTRFLRTLGGCSGSGDIAVYKS